MPKELLSLDAVEKHRDYYHEVLEPLFFEVLNEPVASRMGPYRDEPFSLVPYLNGGLFSASEDDFYERRSGEQSAYHNTLVVPDEWIRQLFAILETYNFTIDENTSYDEELSIDPEMLGRIFENLLAEINPETGESARKSTGSYYTPRVIVDYMVDESLVRYIKQRTGFEDEKIRAIVSYEWTDETDHRLSPEEKIRVLDALEDLKLLDPACGSGAFPIGALQKIVFILQQIDPQGQLWFKKQLKRASPELRRAFEREYSRQNVDYITKLRIIRENIYGIDIQPIATEISRLRCFLTLIVDERVDDSLENRGIEPLPNLDFKFVTANSLIYLPTAEPSSQMGLFEDFRGIEELREIRDMFFTASGRERDQLKSQFAQAQSKMLQRLIEKARLGHAELTTRLASWDPFGNESSAWFDPQWIFGVKTGFDIVIANPPWVSLSGKHALEDNKRSAPKLKKMYSGNTYMPNLYEYFILRSLALLRDNGLLTFIVPDRFGFNESSTFLRARILKEYALIDVVYRWKFEAIIADTMTFLVQHSTQHEDEPIRMRYGPGFPALSFSNGELLDNPNHAFRSYKSESIRRLVGKIRMQSERLIKYYRTTSGFGGKSDLITSARSSSKQIKVIKGKSIGRYEVLENLYFEFVEKNITGRTTDASKLSAREKVLLRKTGNSIIAAYDSTAVYPEQSLYFTYTVNKTFNLKYLLALLNSKLLTWFYLNELVTNVDSTPQLKQFDLDSLPVVHLPGDKQQGFVELVDKIIQLKRSEDYYNNTKIRAEVEDYDRELDQMVYHSYGLTATEIREVEGKQGK